MAARPDSKYFRFKKLLLDNGFTQAWDAIDLCSGRRCFLKKSSKDSRGDQNLIKETLRNSFECQRILRHRNIVTAIRGVTRGYDWAFAYPFLDPATWLPVTPRLFWKHFPFLLTEACLLLDYVHLMGMVHNDIKLSHFLIRQGGAGVSVKLVDLDFLMRSNFSLNSKLLGTPGYMAPEVINNDIITAASDNYSLGVALKKCCQSVGSQLPAGCERESDLRKLVALTENLTQQERLHRPRILLHALCDLGVIDSCTHDVFLKRLLNMKIFTCVRNQSGLRAGTLASISDFLVSKVGAFGLPDDLGTDFGTAFHRKPAETLLLVRRIVRMGEISRHGDYFQVSIPDSLAIGAFTGVDRILDREPLLPDSATESQSADVELLIARAQTLKESEHFLKAYLCLRNALAQLDSDTPDDKLVRQSVLRELSYLARAINRPAAAADFLGQAMKLCVEPSQEHLKVLQDLAFLNLSSRKFTETENLVDAGLSEAHTLQDKETEIRLRSYRAWIHGASGELQQARDAYGLLIKEANESKLTSLLASLYNGLGVLVWRSGEHTQSKALLQKSFKLAQKHGQVSDGVSAARNLSLLYFELADYAGSVKFGKLAAKSIHDPLDRIKLPFIHARIFGGYVRLADYRKAEYWLQRAVVCMLPNQDTKLIADHYQYQGWFAFNRGNTLMAKEALSKVLESAEWPEHERTIGKAYQVLAEISLYEGNMDDCLVNLDRAERIFNATGEKAANTELKFLKTLNAYYSSDRTSHENLSQQLQPLISENCRYYAGMCLFHLLVRSDSDSAQSYVQMASQIRSLIDKSDVPLFQALRLLIAWHEDSQLQPGEAMSLLKAAYRVLDAAGHSYLAVRVCEKIAIEYSSGSRTKLAKKFFIQAAKLARTLRNEQLEEEYIAEIDKIDESKAEQQSVFRSIYGISEILRSMNDFNDALQKIVQYAVDQTGAERGVLLLRPDQNSDLRVTASVHCDEPSLKDIFDFSRTLPDSAAATEEPLIIENARIDKRTRDYKSVIAHNVLSVICVPVMIENKLPGVLYLDHHTIPALFVQEDITFVSAIANFVSAALTNAHRFRSNSITTDRLQHDLSQAGIGSSLITKDKVMLDMLSRIPEIARTNASILIVGESGTGKEILCNLVHELSLRSDAAFVKLNCAAIPDTLIESELFGVVKGVATGVQAREGKFSAADGGTLFLDEVGDLSLEVQAKVLRVLECQQFEKVGSNLTTSTDIRFIYATNKDLPRMIEEGKFRQDLYYRINTITIELPPLRERPDDIMLLAEHFINVYAPDARDRPRFTSAAIEVLMAYSWPGNIRELRNVIERLCILRSARLVDVNDLPAEILHGRQATDNAYGSAVAHEKASIKKLLVANVWNQSKVSRIMKIPLTTLRRRIKKYRITRTL